MTSFVLYIIVKFTELTNDNVYYPYALIRKLLFTRAIMWKFMTFCCVQIEGAFIQGLGWVALEELKWGDSAHKWIPPGCLYTCGPGSYKIPSINDVPFKFSVSLLKVCSISLSTAFQMHGKFSCLESFRFSLFLLNQGFHILIAVGRDENYRICSVKLWVAILLMCSLAGPSKCKGHSFI